MTLAAIGRAAQATFDRFRAVPFSWDSADEATCVHALAFHLSALGYPVPDVPGFATRAGARRALEAMGYASLAALIDGLGLERIVPARMRIGDVAILPGDRGRTNGVAAAIVICSGPGFMGWHGAGNGFVDMSDLMPHVKVAWRV